MKPETNEIIGGRGEEWGFARDILFRTRVSQGDFRGRERGAQETLVRNRISRYWVGAIRS